MSTADDAEQVAVLSVAIKYSDVASRLTSMGLRQIATLSWSPGSSPDIADWRGAQCEIRFETDPATGLRLLRASGTVATGWNAGFDLMDVREAQQLIASTRKQEAMGGLKAAQHMGASELLDAVSMRLLDEDDDIGGEAAMAVSSIARHERIAAAQRARGTTPA